MIQSYLKSLRLRIPDPELEREFLGEYAQKALGTLRFNILLAAVLFALVGYFDTVIIPDIKDIAWAIRFAIVCPIMLLILAATFVRGLQRYLQWLIAFGVLIVGLGVIAMIALAREPGNHLYYAGLLITFMYLYGLTLMRFSFTSAVCGILVIVYEVTALTITRTPFAIFMNNTFFLVTANFIGMYSHYTIERYRRQEFLQKRAAEERAAELERANRKAEAASRAKSEFLANVSHELRTPLNSIIGFSEIMKKGMTGDLSEEQKEYCKDIWESGKHLLRLINDILDLSKIEAGMMTLDLGTVDVKRTIQDCLTLFRERAMRQGIAISCDIAETVGEITADERKIKQVIFNLVSNALKFTPDSGRVGLVARRNTDHVLVTVWDTGIGMTPEDMTRLFRPFQQLDTTLTKQYEGTGLGLHLCKNIIEMHHGAIWVESKVSQGSKFHFTIPAEAARA